jgi:DNA-binding NarL/FixJ family response regulator
MRNHRKVLPLYDAVVLSTKQLVVLTGIVDGKTNQEIANDMDVSPETVKTWIARLCRKLSLRNRTALAVWAVRNQKVEHVPTTRRTARAK